MYGYSLVERMNKQNLSHDSENIIYILCVLWEWNFIRPTQWPRALCIVYDVHLHITHPNKRCYDEALCVHSIKYSTVHNIVSGNINNNSVEFVICVGCRIASAVSKTELDKKNIYMYTGRRRQFTISGFSPTCPCGLRPQLHWRRRRQRLRWWDTQKNRLCFSLHTHNTQPR